MRINFSYSKIIPLIFKIIVVILGVIVLTFSISYLLGGLTKTNLVHDMTPGFIMDLMGSAIGIMSGIVLISILPESLIVRFRRPSSRGLPNPTYGFYILLAIGIGSTIGSPLFIILPVNVEQYAIISIISLLLATTLSFLMAKIYNIMYRQTRMSGMHAIGGPSFVKMAIGPSSVRYFISRFSMWIANTALAAFSAIFFVEFNFQVIPGILNELGLSGILSSAVIYSITGIFIFWFVLNAFFERRFIRHIGFIQVALVIILVGVIVYQALSLGFIGSWNISGIFSLPHGNITIDILENTGYLFILFFGFQEIQAMEREALENGKIPLLSRIHKGKLYSKETQIFASMFATVLIASTVMILLAFALFSLHANSSAVSRSSIPMIYIAGQYLGPFGEAITAAIFLIATITTFVPAFLAASRHLRTLGEEGFFPKSVSSVSWVFTLALILVLSLSNGPFLVNITDFMVLTSLAMISLSLLWNRRRMPGKHVFGSVISLIVGAGCLIAAVSVYFEDPSVVLLGAVAIVLSYMIYDALMLGSVGLQLFIALLDIILFFSISVLPFYQVPTYFYYFPAFPFFTAFTSIKILSIVLAASAAAIIINLTMDLFIINRIKINPGWKKNN
ncbi:APC family permease [Oxyplasma meridianum]|uniref:APC family permease n=1 Tax=Oxyplasma meridianum TaxID=3073602 RepID=A0AAX4NH74_9ARCH